MTVEEIYLKLKDELSAENEISSSPERIFIKNEEHTICTLGMNRSHEIIFVEFKPAPKDLSDVQREGFVHPHPVEMLHDAGWRQAQITVWEEAEKLIGIINRSYKKKKKASADDLEGLSREEKLAVIRQRHVERQAKKRRESEKKAAASVQKSASKKEKSAAKPKSKPTPKKVARKAKPAGKAASRPKAKPARKAKPVKKAKPVAKKAPRKSAKKAQKKGKKKR